jgi:hypothetical protein
MAVTQAVSTQNPNVYAIGNWIVYEHTANTVEWLNWVFGHRPHVHVNLTCGTNGWATGAVGVLRARFRAKAIGFTEVLRGRLKIATETVTVKLGARCYFAAAETGDVRITVGATSATLSFTDADNGTEKTTTLATAATGTGWLTWTVELDQTAGAGTANYLYSLRIQDVKITAGLPAPGDE